MISAPLIRLFRSAALLLLAAGAGAQVEVPPLTRRVTDLTGTLSAGEQNALEATLRNFEEKKGSQIAVLIVPTTAEEAIEQYSIRVFDRWKLGRKKIDDGVLLLVAKNDRRLRIEVGYGLEGALPDAIAKRIIEEVITPQFRAGNFYGGISAGVDRIIRTVEGEPLPAPPERRNAGNKDFPWEALLIPAFFGFAFGRIAASLLGGLGVFVATLMATGNLFAAGLAGLLGAVISFFLFFFLPIGPRTGGRRGGGGWSSGGWSSGGGGWSSGGGGGGFSGGGGGGGGGGASGSW